MYVPEHSVVVLCIDIAHPSGQYAIVRTVVSYHLLHSVDVGRPVTVTHIPETRYLATVDLPAPVFFTVVMVTLHLTEVLAVVTENEVDGQPQFPPGGVCQ